MCNFCMLVHPPRHGVDTLQKNTLTLEKKNGRLWRGTLLTVILIPPLQQPCSFFIFRYINSEIVYQPRLFLAEVYHLSQQFSTDPL